MSDKRRDDTVTGIMNGGEFFPDDSSLPLWRQQFGGPREVTVRLTRVLLEAENVTLDVEREPSIAGKVRSIAMELADIAVSDLPLSVLRGRVLNASDILGNLMDDVDGVPVDSEFQREPIKSESAGHLERVAELEAKCERLETFLRDLFVDGCEYGDNCPRFIRLKHYTCQACQVRYFLDKLAEEAGAGV